MRISDWSSDVCSSDLPGQPAATGPAARRAGWPPAPGDIPRGGGVDRRRPTPSRRYLGRELLAALGAAGGEHLAAAHRGQARAETVATLAHQLAWLIGSFTSGSPSDHRSAAAGLGEIWGHK